MYKSPVTPRSLATEASRLAGVARQLVGSLVKGTSSSDLFSPRNVPTPDVQQVNMMLSFVAIELTPKPIRGTDHA